MDIDSFGLADNAIASIPSVPAGVPYAFYPPDISALRNRHMFDFTRDVLGRPQGRIISQDNRSKRQALNAPVTLMIGADGDITNADIELSRKHSRETANVAPGYYIPGVNNVELID